MCFAYLRVQCDLPGRVTSVFVTWYEFRKSRRHSHPWVPGGYSTPIHPGEPGLPGPPLRQSRQLGLLLQGCNRIEVAPIDDRVGAGHCRGKQRVCDEALAFGQFAPRQLGASP
jgi:hypothetical protein